VTIKPPTVSQFLSGYPPNIRAIAGELRALVKKAVPDVHEEVKSGWRLIGYRVGTTRGSAYFAFIAPSQERVELGFEYGALIADPNQLINKKSKQVHSVVIRNSAEIDIKPTIELIHQAAMVAIEKKELKIQ